MNSLTVVVLLYYEPTAQKLADGVPLAERSLRATVNTFGIEDHCLCAKNPVRMAFNPQEDL